MSNRTRNAVAFLIVGLACAGLPCASRAATSVRFSGSIMGVVADRNGVPQMGAAVLLYNHQDRVFEKAITDQRGEFRFLGLFPDLYSVRVTLAAFVPALKKGILVQPGMRSVLAIDLNTLVSSIQLMYPPVENGSLMTDDWKWVLRGSSATRPVLRFDDAPLDPAPPTSRGTVFSETRGLVRVSGGEGQQASGIADEADMGTAFALATSVFGNNLLEVSGDVGYGSQTGVPVAAFRTSYSRRTDLDGPVASVTVRQLYLPGRQGSAAVGSDVSQPIFRSLAAGFDDRTQITDNLAVQYGVTLDALSIAGLPSQTSPYSRLSYTPGEGTEISFAYTSGNARPDLAGASTQDADLQHDLNTLGLIPRMSERGGRVRIQRGQEYEMAYARKVRSRRYELSAYREVVTNAALSMVAPAGMYNGADVLPDLLTGNSIFNAGDYRSTGYTASATQSLGDRINATLMLGSMGALTAEDRELVSNNPDDLRSMIHAGRKMAATGHVDATLPGSGTHVVVSYQWTDHNWAMPGHIYSTETLRPMPGLNLFIRQPLPGFLPCRVELTADLRNLLAQGYLPLSTADGQRILLVETPRAFRGGLNFIF
ncbi:MAG: carboxypeptidase-like regulatory domain-containing protein [Bryobacteraceae bacterium]